MSLRFTLLSILFSISIIFIHAQERIDGTLSFQTDPAKQYSIYVPSTYEENTPNKLMLGFHPFNTSRWNSMSWCDTLIAFAETNNLLLICPDGGVDGKIDDPIDTAFTSMILDSMEVWYNVDDTQIYAMGFSWGGKTTYTYGLQHVERFAGFMPIGAAVNVSEVNGISANAKDKPFYVVHGYNDSPSSRFYPLVNAMEEASACVETNLMSGVGHTIDFPNRNNILTIAFEWLETINCGETTLSQEINELTLSIFPNPIESGQNLQLNDFFDEVLVYTFDGKLVGNTFLTNEIEMNQKSGVYNLVLIKKGKLQTVKIMVE